jgi:hypothetical protein
MYSAATQMDIPVIRMLTVTEIMDTILRSKLDTESCDSKHACELTAGSGANFLLTHKDGFVWWER